MSLPLKLIYKAIRDRALADTGTGGLFNVASPLLKGWYTKVAPTEVSNSNSVAKYPYVVTNLVDANAQPLFEASNTEVLLRISLFTSGDNENLIDSIRARIIGDALEQTDRVPVFGFDRKILTVTGHGMTAMLFKRQNEIPSEHYVQTILDFSFHVSRQGT